jgi:hypothetical protein
MKTPQIWFEVRTYDLPKRWRWKPSFIKSHIVYELGGKGWMAPHWELVWLCFVFHWTGYSHKKEWRNNVLHHECPADLMQERINELEVALQKVLK